MNRMWFLPTMNEVDLFLVLQRQEEIQPCDQELVSRCTVKRIEALANENHPAILPNVDGLSRGPGFNPHRAS